MFNQSITSDSRNTCAMMDYRVNMAENIRASYASPIIVARDECTRLDININNSPFTKLTTHKVQ